MSAGANKAQRDSPKITIERHIVIVLPSPSDAQVIAAAATSYPSRKIFSVVSGCIEPISKSSEEDNEAGELYKAEEVLSVILPADEDATLPLYPGEEALDEPAPRVTA